ncbi:MAG: helix-turn-helix domain-containing protein [Chloroflexi bacterium]|nr:helix-turn-helix domain-containing protein [Chloroflexota bacterium]MYC63424.1 helix-turn-helix domain-containing protein [Caldilineaceae bacterium SB0661_bin_34]
MRATARLLGISRTTVSNYVRANRLPGRRIRAAPSLQERRDTDRIAAQLD